MNRLGVFRWVVRNWTVSLSLCIVVLFIFSTIVAPYLAPHDPNAQHLEYRLTPPMWYEGGVKEFPLGTDRLGRDILSRLLFGGRISLTVGVTAVLISMVVGAIVGAAMGYYGRGIDFWVSRLIDVQLAIPSLILILLLVVFLGPSLKNIIIVLGLTGWVTYARLARGEALQLRAREFVEAAQAVGGSSRYIIRKHIIPNVLSPVVVIGSLEVGRRIITEASLSYLGLGVPPPASSWGRMIAEGRNVLAEAWWLATFPGIALTLVVVSISVVGDYLREATDPRLKGL
jgi:peptide/nickel transport system permease protein